MKQSRYGRKVVNWHRNEVSSHRKRQIKSANLRDRELFDSRREISSFNDIIEADKYYEVSLCDIFYECPCCPSWDGNENLEYIHSNKLFNEILFTRNIQSLDSVGKLDFIYPDSAFVKPQPAPDIYDFYCLINNTDKFSAKLGIQLIQSSIARGRKIVRDVEYSCNSHGFSNKVCLFSPYWIRTPESWDPNGKVDLIQHLFEKYPIPTFLRKCWYNTNDQKWLIWHIIFSQGLSFKKYADKFGWDLNNKFPFALLSISTNIKPVDAAFKAQILSMGGNETDFLRLSFNDYFTFDPTELRDPRFKKFWLETIAWFIRNRDSLMEHECRLILEWAMHRYTETECHEHQHFSWKRRAIPSVLRAARAYNRSLERPFANAVWAKYGLERSYDIEEDRWAFTELNSGQQLFEESKAMHHCVSTYSNKCISGDTAIVSLSKNDCREVTLEISLAGRTVVQAKKSYNKPPNRDERKIIELWKKDIKKAGSIAGLIV